MNSKHRVHAAMAGQPIDRFPVAALYSYLAYQDHFEEITGEPAWRCHEWLNAPNGEMFLRTFRRMVDAAPFEILQPSQTAPSRAWRERNEYLLRDGKPFRHDRKTDEWFPIEPTRSGHTFDYRANERQTVFNQKDADEQIHVVKAEDAIAEGVNDFIDAVVATYGAEEFILPGGVIGCLYSCHQYLGMLNLLAALVETPGLVDDLCRRLLDQNIEIIRRLAAAGGDAIYIDDALATCDMISVEHYERFCLPYAKAMVKEIHRLEHRAILIYFGGVSDRLEQILATGADAIQVEASMKGYVNDMPAIIDAIGDRVCLFANIDPVNILQRAPDEALEAEIRRQCEAGTRARGFIVSPASPITPGTSIARMQRFIELGRRLGTAGTTG